MLTEVATTACEAIFHVRKVFGPPGDYGYDTPEGRALVRLYDAHNALLAALDLERGEQQATNGEAEA